MGVCTRESMAQSRVKGRQPGIEYETISILHIIQSYLETENLLNRKKIAGAIFSTRSVRFII